MATPEQVQAAADAAAHGGGSATVWGAAAAALTAVAGAFAAWLRSRGKRDRQLDQILAELRGVRSELADLKSEHAQVKADLAAVRRIDEVEKQALRDAIDKAIGALQRELDQQIGALGDRVSEIRGFVSTERRRT